MSTRLRWSFVDAAIHHALRETDRDWDKDLAEDVKGECEEKYGRVEGIKIEKETQVRELDQQWESVRS